MARATGERGSAHGQEQRHGCGEIERVSGAWRSGDCPSAIMIRSGQVGDASRLFRFGSRVAAPHGADVGIERIEAEPQRADAADLDDLADVVSNIDTARALLDGLLVERHERIRRCLLRGVSYRALGRATGLSRPALDAIGRGALSRRSL